MNTDLKKPCLGIRVYSQGKCFELVRMSYKLVLKFILMAKKGLIVDLPLTPTIMEDVRAELMKYSVGEQPKRIRIAGKWEDFPDWLKCADWSPKDHETVLAGALDQQFNCYGPEMWVEWEIEIEE